MDGEALTTPYHVYDGSLMLLGGTVDAAVAADLLAGERLAPLLDERGRALAALWVGDFTRANLGPHHELQFSLFATSEPVRPLASHPFALFRALTAAPEMRMVCHGLWNNTRRAVRYNATHLKLDAHLALSDIELAGGYGRFRFSDEEGNMIAQGDLGPMGDQSPVVMWQMLRHIGIWAALRSMRVPFVRVPVVNTRGPYSTGKLVAQTYAQSARQRIRRFDARDRLEIVHPNYAGADFRPAFVQQMDGFRFVYLRPLPEDGKHGPTDG